MIVNTSASFTRPNDTTAYASGDLIANSTTAGSVTPMSFQIASGIGFSIWRASVKFNSATPTNAQFKLHLYKASPTVTNGDNGAWLSTESGYLGSISVDASTLTFSDSTTGWSAQLTAPLTVPTDTNPGKLFGLLTATAAYTPIANEVFTVTLVGESYN